MTSSFPTRYLRDVINSRWLPLLVLLAQLGPLPAGAEDRSAPGVWSDALRIVRESRAGWRLGRLKVREKDGQPRVRFDLIADGKVIGQLRVDPSSGGFLGEDDAAGPAPAQLDLSRLRADAERALRDIEVGDRTWPTEHGQAWRVPLRYQGRVIGTIKVDVRKGRLRLKD
jgi:hypothetical protein